jgi:hypothetical protein
MRKEEEGNKGSLTPIKYLEKNYLEATQVIPPKF